MAYYDINGNPLTLGEGQKAGSGSLFGNAIFNVDGTTAGQYYTSPEDAAYWRQRTQDTINGGAVAGPQTMEQQNQQMQQKLTPSIASTQSSPYSFNYQQFNPYQQFSPYQSNPYGMGNYGMSSYGMGSYGMGSYGMNGYSMPSYTLGGSQYARPSYGLLGSPSGQPNANIGRPRTGLI